MTNTKKLKNLVWCDIQDFSTLSADADAYNPGTDYWDVAALDVYDDKSGFSQQKYDVMVRVSGGKPIAIGECRVILLQPNWWPSPLDLLHGLVGAGVQCQFNRSDQTGDHRR